MRFLDACARRPVDATPVWLMRQAGRYMAEYRAIRERLSFIEMCRQPEVAAEVTLQPVRAFNLDAAIIFADILLPLEGMGIGFRFAEGEGPLIERPVRSASDLARVRAGEPERDVTYVMEAIRLVRAELAGRVPLIGFAGAPFTLASYVIEGGHSRNFERVKGLMFGDPATFSRLMELLADTVTRYLLAQVDAGAQALQLFDSWVGCLAPNDYRRFVLPHAQRVFAGVGDRGVPVIHFAGGGATTLLPLIAEAGGDVISVDWRIELDDAWARIGYERGIQGNLDPAALFAPAEEIRRRVADILARAGGRPGHVFNLGHGILPGTPPDNVEFLVDIVHRLSARGEAGDPDSRRSVALD